MIKILKLFTLPFMVSFFLLPPTSVSAGQIVLKNGDIIHGELQAIEQNSVVWSSDIFGEIKLPKEQVAQLTSSNVLPVSTQAFKQTTNENSGEKTVNCSFELGSFAPSSFKTNSESTQQLTAHCRDRGEQKTTFALANITTVKVRPAPPPFQGEAKFGYNNKSGNTNSEELDMAISAQWIRQQFRHELGLLAESDSSEGETTDEKYTVDYQLNYDFHDQWFSYGQAKYEKNRFSAIEEQYQFGAGLGHRRTLDNDLHINAQLGGTLLSTKRPSSDTESGSRDNDIAGRWGLKLDWPIPSTKITAFHHHELLWVADAVDDNQLESSTGIKIPLFGGIFSEVRYDFDHVSEPANDQKHADHEWVISLGYHW